MENIDNKRIKLDDFFEEHNVKDEKPTNLRPVYINTINTSLRHGPLNLQLGPMPIPKNPVNPWTYNDRYKPN